ncbi:hypothetical protein F0562_024388 [Nyssa sinensis]|uniref:Disease resistance N-terminal domain-containing protein n=1 Tax=Nyssa sinensis TaxID=561372 RepID=A0A5J5BCA0_9ASTE|nr:hypothetical protein F0562_024388 [Nyssa sinensis]
MLTGQANISLAGNEWIRPPWVMESFSICFFWNLICFVIMANALLNVVLKSLKSLIEEEIGLLWGVDKEMKKLSSTLSTIQAVLEDAELKQLQDKALQDWLRKLKHAAYAVDDILDECATEAIAL